MTPEEREEGKKEAENPRTYKKRDPKPDKDIDEALEETFPASDPPSY